MRRDRISIQTESGQSVEAQAPVIVSASRATDVPAFYSDWFFRRLEAGYVKWKNPFNGKALYVSFRHTRLIVFWSKNPGPLIRYLDCLDEKKLNYYFQFTLNDYEAEKLEPGVPSLQARMDTFMELAERTGREKVIWRFDPLILTEKLGVDDLLKKAETIGNCLKNHTRKLVFSFADIQAYRKVQRRLQSHAVPAREFSEKDMHEWAEGLQRLNENWGFELATCAEAVALEKYGIAHNRCVDDGLALRLFSQDKALMDFLGVKPVPPDLFDFGSMGKERSLKDSGQRPCCGCIPGKDIGRYGTCPHLCLYCYANARADSVWANWRLHGQHPDSEAIVLPRGGV
jgi:DNA repair photolyase